MSLLDKLEPTPAKDILAAVCVSVCIGVAVGVVVSKVTVDRIGANRRKTLDDLQQEFNGQLVKVITAQGGAIRNLQVKDLS